MKGIIYKATNTFNGMVYIGQTINTLDKRKREHIKEAQNPEEWNRFHLALFQYPSSFNWEIIDTFDGDRVSVTHSLNIAEEYHILKNNSADPMYGYNANTGGYSSAVLSKRLKALAKKHEGTCKAMLQYDRDGNFVKEWESLSEIARTYSKSNKTNASALVNGIHYGYMWRIKESNFFPRHIEPLMREHDFATNAKPCVVYDINGNLWSEFSTQKAAYCVLGGKGGTRVIQGQIRDIQLTASSTAKYYIFKKPDGDYPKSITIFPYVKKEKKPPIICSKRVAQYNLDGTYIKSYNSIEAASKDTHGSTQYITRYCQTTPPILLPPNSRMKYLWQYDRGNPPQRIDVIDHRAEKCEILRWKYQPNGTKVKVPVIVCKSQIKYIKTMEHRVIQYSLNGEFIKVWDNSNQAVMAGEESMAILRKQLMGAPIKKTPNYLWRNYSGDYPKTIAPFGVNITTTKRAKDKIVEKDRMGNIIGEWNGASEASKATGLSQSYILNIVAGRIHHPKRRFMRIL